MLLVSCALLFAMLVPTCVAQLNAADGATAAATPLRAVGRQFLLRGKPFQILSGEIEYARIPRADWRGRLRKVHAMGLNTITVYVFWNLHETSPGVFDFGGQKDVAEFLREAQQEGLYVVLRPGPYVCAEWDLGGYPPWLLKDSKTPGSIEPAVLLRSAQPEYLAAVKRWMLRLGQELAPLQASRGGPIIAVQVENEYGSFKVDGDRQAYLHEVWKFVRDAGFGESLLYTADGGEELSAGSIPGMLAAIDFGTGDASSELPLLQTFQPDAPVFIAEYWDGWFDHWGEKHHVTDATVEEGEIRAAIEKGYSISLYMVDGGTSFGWMNGANSDGDNYQPDVSSYDYDAPIDEAGRPRAKYFVFRRMIAAATRRALPLVPESEPMIHGKTIRLTQSQSLWSILPNGVKGNAPRSMEELGQGYGYILYRTRIKAGFLGDAKEGSLLKVGAVHSYARVYVDGQLQGVMDRRLGQRELQIRAHAGQRLDVLVENSGRINFTTKIREERAGILGDVTLGGEVLHGWEMIPLPLNVPPAKGYTLHGCVAGPCLYRGSLKLNEAEDTYLNTSLLGKGVVWVNGHLLGRFWDVGPMGSLYLPGAWLRPGNNDVIVMDLNGGEDVLVGTGDHPVYLQPAKERTTALAADGR
ncbi:MAG: beta-galactosidase family protein [Acidobacteriaceae bacterium]